MPKQRLTMRADGRYRCKYHGKYFYGKTQSEAMQKRDEYKKLEKMYARNARNVTVRAYIGEWISCKQHVRPESYELYVRHMNHLIDNIGDVQIGSVNASDMRRVMVEHYAGKSDSYIRMGYSLFNQLFDAAVDDSLIPSNPLRSRSVKLPSGTNGTHRSITEQERRLIWDTPNRMRLVALFMLYTGATRAQSVGIVIQRDIDFAAKLVNISGIVVNGDYQKGRAKNKYRLRSIPLLDALAKQLQGKTGLLCSTKDGSVMNNSYLNKCWKDYMKDLTRAAGHEISIRAHDLRHSYCTMCRDAGIDAEIVAIWMGHSDSTMVRKIYDHISKDRVQNAVKKTNEITSGGQNGGQFPSARPESVDL